MTSTSYLVIMVYGESVSVQTQWIPTTKVYLQRETRVLEVGIPVGFAGK